VNFFGRSMISLVRRPGKTLLLFALVVILGAVISGAVAVSGTINSTEANLRRRMRPIVTIEFDFNGWREAHNVEFGDAMPQIPPITSQMLHSIGALSYINFYNINFQFPLRSFELARYGSRSALFGGVIFFPCGFKD